MNGMVKLMVNVKEHKLGKNTRMSFAKNQFPCELPSLVEVQTKSFQWFLEEGLAEVLTEKCLGHSKVAEEKFRKFMDEFGKHDLELDRYFDFGLAADSIYKIVVAKTRNKLEVL